ncbi:hypothetical protein [Microbacterium sp. PMB16]|uniref:hypothetical protein n=1 Tax=Microbacterium sp. PMB16 TaxID=3120157 RepID=UPI003F4C4D79
MTVEGPQTPASFSGVFAAALTASGVTLSWLQRRLVAHANPVSIATLSYWRSGERSPEGTASLAAVEDIERLLGIAPGALSSLIPERLRLGTLHNPHNPFTEALVLEALDETLELLDAPPLDITRELSTHVVSDVGADGVIHHRTAQSLIQAVAPTVDLVTYTLVSAEGTLLRPELSVRGARVVRDHLHESQHVYAYVLQLDQPLVLGATTMIAVTMDRHDAHTAQVDTGAFVVRPIRDLVLWTRFHPDAIPDWIDELEKTDPEADMVDRPIRPRASIHQSRRDFGPGALGLRWGYDR